MACMEHVCHGCGHVWINNEVKQTCPQCGTFNVSHYFDEHPDKGGKMPSVLIEKEPVLLASIFNVEETEEEDEETEDETEEEDEDEEDDDDDEEEEDWDDEDEEEEEAILSN